MKQKSKKSGKGWRENKKEVLTEKGIERKALIHRKVQMKNRYSNTLRVPFAVERKNEGEELADEIIESVQKKRSESAVAKDNARTAENVGDKDDAKDLVSWVKSPNKSDLKDVDTNEDD